MRCPECSAEIFKEREEEKMNHYKTIINNLINIYCGIVYVDDWDINEWHDFLETIGFSVEEIDDFLSNRNLL